MSAAPAPTPASAPATPEGTASTTAVPLTRKQKLQEMLQADKDRKDQVRQAEIEAQQAQSNLGKRFSDDIKAGDQAKKKALGSASRER